MDVAGICDADATSAGSFVLSGTQRLHRLFGE